MGRTPKPLKLLVHPDLSEFPIWEKLSSQGHTIVFDSPSEFDWHVGPNCWYMTPAHEKYVDVMVKEARKKRYHNSPKTRKAKNEKASGKSEVAGLDSRSGGSPGGDESGDASVRGSGDPGGSEAGGDAAVNVPQA